MWRPPELSLDRISDLMVQTARAPFRVVSFSLSLPFRALTLTAEGLGSLITGSPEHEVHVPINPVPIDVATEPSAIPPFESSATQFDATSPTPQASCDAAPVTTSEDDALGGVNLKLIRFRIYFVKRGLEQVLHTGEDLIADDLTDLRYCTWKIAEYIQSMNSARTAPAIPPAWGAYPPPNCRHRNGRLRALPAEDTKFLRVSFDVLRREVRQPLRFEERQLELLRDVSEALAADREEEMDA